MIDKLMQASTESLLTLKANIETILASRLDTELRRGRIASFEDGKGNTRKIRIERINERTCSGVEVGDSLNPGGKWRVGKGQLQVVPEVRKTPGTMNLKVPHRPTTVAGDSW